MSIKIKGSKISEPEHGINVCKKTLYTINYETGGSQSLFRFCDICSNKLPEEDCYTVSDADCKRSHKDPEDQCYYRVCSKECANMAIFRLLN